MENISSNVNLSSTAEPLLARSSCIASKKTYVALDGIKDSCYGKMGGVGYATTFSQVKNPAGAVAPAALPGLDIGVIHLGMVSDGDHALAVSGRGLRSVKQGRAKAQAKLRKKRARTKPGSRRRQRLTRARHRASQKVERVTRNALHHAANQIVAFCLAYGLTILYAGDLGTLNHHKRHRRSRRTNQDVGALEFGRWELYLEYQLRRYGIQLIQISEAYTSQTCPQSGHLNKGMHGEIRPGALLVPPRITYRRPVPLKGLKGTLRRSCG